MGQPFVTAVVVRSQAPISGKPGNKAIILPDGNIWGWIGGGCAQPVVIKEAFKALADGQPRLVRISPSASPEEGIVDYTMTCHSGGTLDIYIEPVLPRPRVLILGRSPVAVALAKVAKAIEYSVAVVGPGKDRERFPECELVDDLSGSESTVTQHTFVVVCTQGEDDEEAMEKALRSEAQYVAFVASKKKASKVFDYLKDRGISAGRIGQVKAPAGLDIHAASPEEIAVSILAEIIQQNGSRAAARKAKAEPIVSRLEAKDPICGMMVSAATAKYKSEYQGNSFYFCCAGCKQKFDKLPEKYARAQA